MRKIILIIAGLFIIVIFIFLVLVVIGTAVQPKLPELISYPNTPQWYGTSVEICVDPGRCDICASSTVKFCNIETVYVSKNLSDKTSMKIETKRPVKLIGYDRNYQSCKVFSNKFGTTLGWVSCKYITDLPSNITDFDITPNITNEAYYLK